MIHLHSPLGIYEQGRRELNQDCMYPMPSPDAGGRIFIVCDGVGGSVRGEEASRIVCEVLALYFQKREYAEDADFRQALKLAEMALDEFVQQNPDAEGMATTLALLFLHDDGVTAGHIGDSRVYQFRKGDIHFKTHDHSLINELIAGNIITPEQAGNHPSRNVVTRAIMGSRRPSEMDIAHLHDVQPGDYFFLCSDGILESFSDTGLAQLLAREDLNNEEKLELISNTCRQNSRDNYSAWLLAVAHVNTAGNGQLSESGADGKATLDEQVTSNIGNRIPAQENEKNSSGG